MNSINHFWLRSAHLGRYYELIFKGINYGVAVWINGKQIADQAVKQYSFRKTSHF